MEKKEIRKFVTQLRDEVDPELRIKWDNQIFDKVIHSIPFQQAQMIFLFVNYVSEVNTADIIQYALDHGKRVCVPKVISKAEGLALYELSSLKDLVPGFKGILEPGEVCKKADPLIVDLVLMPGVAFDLSGGRIGYGGGYYDRFVGKLRNGVQKIAVAYELQLLNDIPMDEHDVRIDGIITEKRMELFK